MTRPVKGKIGAAPMMRRARRHRRRARGAGTSRSRRRAPSKEPPRSSSHSPTSTTSCRIDTALGLVARKSRVRVAAGRAGHENYPALLETLNSPGHACAAGDAAVAGDRRHGRSSRCCRRPSSRALTTPRCSTRPRRRSKRSSSDRARCGGRPAPTAPTPHPVRLNREEGPRRAEGTAQPTAASPLLMMVPAALFLLAFVAWPLVRFVIEQLLRDLADRRRSARVRRASTTTSTRSQSARSRARRWRTSAYTVHRGDASSSSLGLGAALAVRSLGSGPLSSARSSCTR